VVNPNTVAKAYRELDHAGLASARSGQGTFVTSSVGEVPTATNAQLSRRLRGWLRSAREAGLTPEQVRALVAASLDDDESRSGAA
jgi:GntR family transcriptional regulator